MDDVKRVQLRVRPKAIIAEGCGGSIFWATEQRAKLLLAAGACDLVNDPNYMRKPSAVGPQENKVVEPDDSKKSSADDPDGLSTDSVSSVESGAAAPSSASEEGQASVVRSASTSSRRSSTRK